MAEIPCPLEEGAARYGNGPAVISPDETVSYAEFHRRVDRAVSALRSRGCAPGDRIGLFMPNSVAYLVWLLAVIRLGAVACPLNTRVPVRTIAGLLGRIECRTLLVGDMGAVRDQVDQVLLIPCADTGAMAADGPRSSGAALLLEAPATILFTSGSAGPPKAVLHSYGNHYYSARGATRNLPLGVGDRWLLDLPLYHVGGLGIVFRCLLAGAAVVLAARAAPLETVLRRFRITHLSVVVTQLYRLLQRPDPVRYPALRCVVLGGSPVPMKLLTSAQDRGLPVFASYGCTEMASQVTTTDPAATGAQRLTSGRLLPYRGLAIAEDGEILLKGETLFMGYVDGRSVRRPLNHGGWFHTGDLGYLGEDGYLTVMGRRDNRFFSGGETIHPEEIERALGEFDDIEQAVVVPIPHAEFGQRCVAFVRARRGLPSPAVLTRWLERTLPRYKVPDAFYEWPPEDDAQLKIDRARLRRRALALRGVKEAGE